MECATHIHLQQPLQPILYPDLRSYHCSSSEELLQYHPHALLCEKEDDWLWQLLNFKNQLELLDVGSRQMVKI